MLRKVSNSMSRNVLLMLVFVFPLASMGCTGTHERVSQSASASDRNQQLAAELTRQASGLIHSDPDEAMRLLRLATEADLFYGPAHNNMGVVLLNRGQLYEAAEEFDWARRLMPGHPDPRINLGIALERGGKVEDAEEAYASAIEVYPGHLPAVQAMARLHIRSGLHTEETEELLQEIILRGSDEWRHWAMSHLKN
jgi:Tfp pilus assembly protein PilF